MDNLEEVLNERLRLKAAIQAVFCSLFPETPLRLRVSQTQEAVLEELHMSFSGWNRRIVNESVSEMGIRTVFITGLRFYKTPPEGEIASCSQCTSTGL